MAVRYSRITKEEFERAKELLDRGESLNNISRTVGRAARTITAISNCPSWGEWVKGTNRYYEIDMLNAPETNTAAQNLILKRRMWELENENERQRKEIATLRKENFLLTQENTLLKKSK